MSERLASMKEQVYVDPRPADAFDAFHRRAREHRPSGVYELIRVLVTLYAYGIFRLRPIGGENVPPSGPLILAPNHFSFLDHFFCAVGIRRKVRFMAKSQLFSGPLKHVFSYGGVFPVRRGARDDETFVTAERLLADGEVVGMYCEGGRSRSGRLAERAKPGIGRLALRSGATIVPVAIYGSSRVRNWKRLRFPQVTVQYGAPLRFERVERPTREQMQSAADQIFDEIKALYGELERVGRRGVV
ncbi:MAG TPA: lysophospholipid acyltransferase family protein, partial [Solirubrobacteraceae bacterium]|nr:lysophospholipid acyltransferase family protein [Solirubrobacteraceae bacterium]